MDRLLRLFATKDDSMGSRLDDSHRSTGFISGEQNSTFYNPTMISAEESQNMTINILGGTTRIDTSSLSQFIMPGVTHNDVARYPPPYCYINTRLKLLTRIYEWYHDKSHHKLILWITGPAGCGKSAIAQTIAEHLCENKLLGASIFFSKRTGRDRSDRIFITIAYQLSVQIKSYRSFIKKQLTRDQTLVYKDMKTQFAIFIVEPFIEKKLGGNKRWGILLDGLDELEGEDAQRNIIQLITDFVDGQPNAPLVWIISSRKETHIAGSFGKENVQEEHILIDSPESREDVRTFLRARFDATRSSFPQSFPQDWPKEEEIDKIAGAASGLFIYAELAMQFINDLNQGDPKSLDTPETNLSSFLSVIDRSNPSPDPLGRLHNFYGEILLKGSRPIRTHLLGFVVQWQQYSLIFPEGFNTLRGMCIFFGLTRAAIYVCLKECHSILHVPNWDVAHQENVSFLHESFADYLRVSGGSTDSDMNTRDFLILKFFEIWDRCFGGDITTVSVESEWHKYCAERDNKTVSEALKVFHSQLFCGFVSYLRLMVNDNLARPRRVLLHKIHMIKLCYYLNSHDFWNFAVALLLNYSPELTNIGFACEVKLEDLTFHHFDWEGMSPARVHFEAKDKTPILHRPRSSDELQSFITELTTIQDSWQATAVFVYGSIPQGRVVVFQLCDISNAAFHNTNFTYMAYYILPYSE